MRAVIINGQESAVNTGGAPQVSDLIELIKSMIDPEHMITSILLDGKELEESDWTASTRQFETSILEIQTGTPAEFVATRLSAASTIVQTCYYDFRESRKLFQNAQMREGNKKLAEAVNTLQAFFEWFGALIELVPEGERHRYNIDPQVRELSDVCKRICQQQLYQSWWALGETIERELEPKLDKLEGFFRKWAQ